VRLFLDRATAVRPDFGLDERNVAAVAQVCRRLTACRSPSSWRPRGGSCLVLPRHQTLRALVDWSWELLEEPERVLLPSHP
jgi:predicted ATPase